MTSYADFRLRLSILGSIALVCMLVLASCGLDGVDSDEIDVEDTVDEKAVVPIGDNPDISAWTRAARIYSFDEFIESGWKQHQVYDVETLPKAIGARYGFYNRKDIEIREYPSHEAAMDTGVSSAEDALGRKVHDGSGFASRRVYGGYLVAGNMVMLCEVSVSDCTDLLDRVDALQ